MGEGGGKGAFLEGGEEVVSDGVDFLVRHGRLLDHAGQNKGASHARRATGPAPAAPLIRLVLRHVLAPRIHADPRDETVEAVFLKKLLH